MASALIASDKVEGTNVYDPNGTKIGSIDRLMIDKLSGSVNYAVLEFGGFMGLGTEEYSVPWQKLKYDVSLGGYRTDISEKQLRGYPASFRDPDYNWEDERRRRELDTYWGNPVI
jgi:sporulation protein YlmC with PRC-barrel domain